MQQNAPAKLRYTVPRKNVHNLNVVSHEETEHVFAIFLAHYIPKLLFSIRIHNFRSWSCLLTFFWNLSRYYYYAALLPRRGPHIASHSVCPSVCLSVCPVIITERHVAPPSELQWHTCTFRHALRAAYRTAISAAQILVTTIIITTTFPSVLWRCWLGDRKDIRPVKSWALVCWWWWFDWSFARLIAPVVTTTSTILSSNKTS